MVNDQVRKDRVWQVERAKGKAAKKDAGLERDTAKRRPGTWPTIAGREKEWAVKGMVNKVELRTGLEISVNIRAREQARAVKNWAEADRLRDEIRAAGFDIIDSPDGPQLKPRS